MRDVCCLMTLCLLALSAAGAAAMERIAVSPDGGSFVLADSGQAFRPWGFNYDHDRDGTLIEDYWYAAWDTVAEDFQEMKLLGANVVRIHLQFGKFMKSPDKPNRKALRRLSRLLILAEETGLYLDLTGLACYHKQDVPPWYDALPEAERWQAQARFWEAIAKRCAGSPAVFCYDLMNEPVAPGGAKRRDDWLGPAFAGKHFVQFVALETAGRDRHDIARAWIGNLVKAIRKHDRRTMITVGLVHWSLDRPGMTSGFSPDKTLDDLDFIAVHLYPETGKVDEALDKLRGFNVGKPVVVEETFPLKASFEEFSTFIERAGDDADGWIGFYWGAMPEEYTPSESIAAAVTRQWLEFFRDRAGQQTD